ncbi:hypothetical protein D3C80_1793500 [compost metagenome]
MTSAIWIWVACMRAINPLAIMDGGTNRTLHMRLSSPIVLVRSIRPMSNLAALSSAVALLRALLRRVVFWRACLVM